MDERSEQNEYNEQTPQVLKIPQIPNVPQISELSQATQIRPIPLAYNLLAFTPPLALATFYSLSQSAAGDLISALLGLIALVAIMFLGFKQFQYIKQYQPLKKLRRQLYLPAAAVLGTAGACTIGDLAGHRTYGTPLQNGWAGYLATGFALAVLLSFVIVLGNMVYIKTVKSGRQSKALRIIGIIFYTIGWLVVAVASFLSYVIVYSSHDPSNE